MKQRKSRLLSKLRSNGNIGMYKDLSTIGYLAPACLYATRPSHCLSSIAAYFNPRITTQSILKCEPLVSFLLSRLQVWHCRSSHRLYFLESRFVPMMVEPKLEREYSRAVSSSSLRPVKARNPLPDAFLLVPGSSLAISQSPPPLSMSALTRRSPVSGVNSVVQPT